MEQIDRRTPDHYIMPTSGLGVANVITQTDCSLCNQHFIQLRDVPDVIFC